MTAWCTWEGGHLELTLSSALPTLICPDNSDQSRYWLETQTRNSCHIREAPRLVLCECCLPSCDLLLQEHQERLCGAQAAMAT